MVKSLSFLLLSTTIVSAGDISSKGSTIEVQDYMCEVTSEYSIKCWNVGRVCVDFRTKEKERNDKAFGCALESNKNYPCEPWEKTTKRIHDNLSLSMTCSTMSFGGW